MYSLERAIFQTALADAKEGWFDAVCSPWLDAREYAAIGRELSEIRHFERGGLAAGSGDDEIMKVVREARDAVVHGAKDQHGALGEFAGRPAAGAYGTVGETGRAARKQ